MVTQAEVEKQIGFPDDWDLAAYPTIWDAMWEKISWFEMVDKLYNKGNAENERLKKEYNEDTTALARKQLQLEQELSERKQIQKNIKEYEKLEKKLKNLNKLTTKQYQFLIKLRDDPFADTNTKTDIKEFLEENYYDHLKEFESDNEQTKEGVAKEEKQLTDCVVMDMYSDDRLNQEWWCARCDHHDGVGCTADKDCDGAYQEVSTIIPPSEYKKK